MSFNEKRRREKVMRGIIKVFFDDFMTQAALIAQHISQLFFRHSLERSRKKGKVMNSMSPENTQNVE
jgi:hypothetical protein